MHRALAHSLARLSACGLLTGSVVACSEEPDVEVNAYVGDRFERADPEVQRELATQIAEHSWLRSAEAWLSTPAPEPTATVGLPTAVHPPQTSAELASLVEAVREGGIDDLAGPARRIAEADASLWPEIATLLRAERKAAKRDYEGVLRAISADTPNRWGHFELAWKKAHGHAVTRSEDWLEDLLALPRTKISRALERVYRDCVLQTALLRAAGRIGRRPELAQDVVATLHDAAFAQHSLFQDEVSRAMTALGDEAVPHLLRRAEPTWRGDKDRFDPEVMRVRFVREQLDRMDRLHPQQAIDAVRDEPRLLARVIEAYGDAKTGEAAELLLRFADDRSPVVRRAAREAFSAYVTGPAPADVRRTVRLLGGETTQTRAYLSYRERASQAIAAALATERPDLLEPECSLVRDNGKPDHACEGRPARMTEAYFEWLDARRRERQAAEIDQAFAAGDPERTAAMLDRLLAGDPDLGHRERLATFFRSLAIEAAREQRFARAAQLFRKTAMLVETEDTALAAQLRVAALMAEASVPEVDPTGASMLLRSAAELDPASEEIARAMDRVQTSMATPTELDPDDRARLLGGTGVAALLFWLLAWLGRPLRSPRVKAMRIG